MYAAAVIIIITLIAIIIMSSSLLGLFSTTVYANNTQYSQDLNPGDDFQV